LQDGDELLADEGLGRGQEGHNAIAHAGLFFFVYRNHIVGEFVVGSVPGSVDPVLDIDNGWGRDLVNAT
jgi:hypothetical protein